MHTITDWFTANAWPLLSDALSGAVIFFVALLLRAVTGRLITHLMTRLHRARVRTNAVHSKLTKKPTEPDERHAQRIQTISAVLRSTASVIIFGVAFVMILSQFQINVAPILASAGVVGLAIGFGAQSLVKDVIAGMFMMAEDQYGVGDVVNVGSAVGTVEGVTLRVVKIRDLDGGLWFVRNGEISSVCNMSQDWANAVVEVPVEPTVEMVKAKTVIQGALDTFAQNSSVADNILEEPTLAGVTSMSHGAFTIRIVIKTKPSSQWAVGRALRETLKQAFDAEGVRIAMPRIPTGTSS